MYQPASFEIDIAASLPSPTTAAAVVVCLFAGEPQPALAVETAGVRDPCAELLRGGDCDGKEDTTLLVHVAHDGGAPRRLLLLGLGARADFTPCVLWRAAGAALRAARAAHVRQLHFMLPNVGNAAPPDAELARAVAEGALHGAYENDFYQQTDDDDAVAALTRLTIVAPAPHDALRAAVARGRIIAESANWARALADEPGASLPPREFARRVAAMAGEFGLTVETLDADEIRARGMGGLWAVGRGSDEPPALIVVRYEPAGASESDELWAFVGKGITFDTGGISLKPGERMEEMKADMAGGAAVFGALRALAQLKPARRLVGIVPAAENMPSGKATKPGDVLRTLAGYTIEVVDTDAEGRLVLVDGIAYARQLGAARIVDLATLTGSIIVALGDHRAGLFSNDDGWAASVLAASARAGEPAWRMPVSDDYKQKIESPIADFKNYGGRPDATAAALLLSKFAADTPWVHLDIAATSWHDEPQPHAPRGATGTGVRTLVELVCAVNL
ncbi:MAG TPA: leucyl aminopeptidase [Pyrinomonadaceae bacterium]|jgi:leucyl aminopeptidase